jgi:hypothetical protein
MFLTFLYWIGQKNNIKMKTEKDFDTIYEYWAYIQGRIDARTEDIQEIKKAMK